jgi:hypothetical protein
MPQPEKPNFDELVAGTPPRPALPDTNEERRARLRRLDGGDERPLGGEPAPRAAQAARPAPDPSETSGGPDLASESLLALAMEEGRGRPVGTTVYLYPDQITALAYHKAASKQGMSEVVREMLDRDGYCDPRRRKTTA